MKQKITALRFMVSTLALTLALGLVCIAQAASDNSTAALAAQDHTATMIADWTRARDYTKEYLDAMPEDGYSFKAAPDIRSFAEQMLHLANANYAFAAGATGMAGTSKVDLEKTDSMKTKAACTKAVMDSYDFVITAIKGFDVKKSGEQVKLFGGRVETTRGLALAKAFEHQTHHRGQATIYLRLKGVKPPAEKLF